MNITEINAATAFQNASGSFYTTRAARTAATATLHTASDAARTFPTNDHNGIVAHRGAGLSAKPGVGRLDRQQPPPWPDTQPARLALVEASGGFLTAYRTAVG